MKHTEWGKRVTSVLYYAFLVLTVGAFLLFIPLHSGLVKKNGSEASHPSSNDAVTHRDTNATGEVVVQSTPEIHFVNWIEEFQIQHQGE